MSKVTAIKKETKTDNEEKVLTFENMRNELSEIEAIMIFLSNSVDHLVEAGEDYIAYGDRNTFGIHLVFHDLIDKTQSLLEDLEKIDQKDKQSLLRNAEAGLSMAEQGAWATKEVAIERLKEDIDKLMSFISYTNECKEKAEGLLKKGEYLLQRYQAVKKEV